MNKAKDILDLLAEFRTGFMRLGIEPPSVILLEDHRAGMQVFHELSSPDGPMSHYYIGSGGSAIPIEHPDGSTWMEVQALGMKIRWPARTQAQPDGGYVWI